MKLETLLAGNQEHCILLMEYLKPRIKPTIQFLGEIAFWLDDQSTSESKEWLHQATSRCAWQIASHLLSLEPLLFSAERTRVLRGDNSDLWEPEKYHLPTLIQHNSGIDVEELLIATCLGVSNQKCGVVWISRMKDLLRSGNAVSKGLVAYYLEGTEFQRLRYNKIPICCDKCLKIAEVDYHGRCPKSSNGCKSQILVGPKPKPKLRFFGERDRLPAKVRACPVCKVHVPNYTGQAGAPCPFCSTKTTGAASVFWYPRKQLVDQGNQNQDDAFEKTDLTGEIYNLIQVLDRFSNMQYMLESFELGELPPRKGRNKRLEQQLVNSARDLARCKQVLNEFIHDDLDDGPANERLQKSARAILNGEQIEPSDVRLLEEELELNLAIIVELNSSINH